MQDPHHSHTLNVSYESLWALVASRFPLGEHSDHGPAHWRRVLRNGLLLAEHTGADKTAVMLFALFHDCQRTNEFDDPGHGSRGAALATAFRGVHFDVPAPTFALLVEACEGHTDGLRHADPTIGTCWDADRLDLPRVGIWPEPLYLSTSFARQVVEKGEIARHFPLA